MVSGGPFVLVEYQQNQETILQANPKFYGPKPIIEGIQKNAKIVTKQAGAMIAWPGLLRMLDRRHAGWRD